MNDDSYAAGGIILAGCMVIGVGVGILTGQWLTGIASAVIGFGIGLGAMGLMVARGTRKK